MIAGGWEFVSRDWLPNSDDANTHADADTEPSAGFLLTGGTNQ